MSKQEIEVIADEIAEAANQGRFNEGCRKLRNCDYNIYSELLLSVQEKLERYEFQRLGHMFLEYVEL